MLFSTFIDQEGETYLNDVVAFWLLYKSVDDPIISREINGGDSIISIEINDKFYILEYDSYTKAVHSRIYPGGESGYNLTFRSKRSLSSKEDNTKYKDIIPKIHKLKCA